MISREEALTLSDKNFPKGPEVIADRVGATVEYSPFPLRGCLGWCWQNEGRVLIRINSEMSGARKRFVLAHEIAHVILGTPAGILKNEPFESDKAEERDADKLAAELLLPEQRVVSFIGDRLPVVASTLKRIGRMANVSSITAACRVVGMTTTLGLQNAAVAFFDDSEAYKWRYSAGLSFPDDTAVELMKHTLASGPPGTPVRTNHIDGNVIVSSVVDAWLYKALFLQLLPADVASQTSAEERLIEIRDFLFGGDKGFQASVAACLGHIRNNHNEKTISDALVDFDETYTAKKWTEEQRARLLSNQGREFLRIELSKSCRPDDA